jgi:hypothetical protein
MQRPSWKELSKKLNQAKEAVVSGSIKTVDPVMIAADAIELDYQVSELKNVLVSLLDEIKPIHYAGSRPPQKSYKSEIIGAEIFAFRWLSKILGCETYIKFCFKQDSLYLVSLHRHREGKGD